MDSVSIVACVSGAYIGSACLVIQGHAVLGANRLHLKDDGQRDNGEYGD